MIEALAALKAFVASDACDGSIGANFTVDKLLWEVRKAHPHNHQSHSRSEPADPGEIEIDLEELGL